MGREILQFGQPPGNALGWVGFPGENFLPMKGTQKNGTWKKANEELWVVLLEELAGKEDVSQEGGPCLAGPAPGTYSSPFPGRQMSQGFSFVYQVPGASLWPDSLGLGKLSMGTAVTQNLSGMSKSKI